MKQIASRAALLASVALLSAGAVPAAAVTRSPPPVTGPVLMGERVAWVADADGQPWLWSAVANRGARRRQPLPDQDNRLGYAEMAASPSRVGVMTGGVENEDPIRGVFGSASGGPLMSLSPRCHQISLLPSLDASGDVIAFEACRDKGDDAVVVDPAMGAASATTVPGAGIGVRIAGRYMAWLENFQPNGQLLWGHRYDIAVFDRVAGVIAYRIPARATVGGVHSFDIQDDGTLALSYVTLNRARDTSVMRVAWASVSSPRLHKVPLRAADSYTVALADNLIGFDRGEGQFIDFGEVGTSDFAGHEHLVARNSVGLIGQRSFDFDGRRLAWWSYGCSAARINVAPRSARTGPRVRRGCPLTFRERPRTVGQRALVFRINCFGFSVCSVRRVVLATRHGRGRVVARGHGRRAHLTPTGKALLRSRKRVRVRMTALITDLAGRKERRHADVTLRRP